MKITDQELVMVRYDHPNRGNHKVFGASTNTFYGYRHGGDVFLVAQRDIDAQPHIFKPVEAKREEQKPAPPPPPPSIPSKAVLLSPIAPSPAAREAEKLRQAAAGGDAALDDLVDLIGKPFDLSLLPGITPAIASMLNANGVHTLDELVELGVTGLEKYKGIGTNRAKIIIAAATEKLKN